MKLFIVSPRLWSNLHNDSKSAYIHTNVVKKKKYLALSAPTVYIFSFSSRYTQGYRSALPVMSAPQHIKQKIKCNRHRPCRLTETNLPMLRQLLSLGSILQVNI